MHVRRGVRMLVVQPMLRRPPQDAALGGGLRQERETELKHAAGPERAMGEVAMVSSSNREDPNQIQHDRQHKSTPGKAGPERRQGSNMDQHEADAGGIRDVV